MAIISKMRDCVVEQVGLEPTTKVLWNMVGVRPTPLVGQPCRSPEVLLFCVIMPGSPLRSYWPISQSRISGDSSFVEKPINSGLFEREPGCPTRWAGRTPPIFHNTLVVGSSPTSSTTQSSLTRDGLVGTAPFTVSGEGPHELASYVMRVA